MSLKYIGTAMMTDQDYVKLFPLSNGWQGKKKKKKEQKKVIGIFQCTT